MNLADRMALEEEFCKKKRKSKMKKFSDMIQKSGNQEKPKARESPVKKRMFKITKRDDEQMLAFGWANVSIRSDGELIEDWQEDIVEPEDLEQAAYEFVQLYREGGEMHERERITRAILKRLWIPKSKSCRAGRLPHIFMFRPTLVEQKKVIPSQRISKTGREQTTWNLLICRMICRLL